MYVHRQFTTDTGNYLVWTQKLKFWWGIRDPARLHHKKTMIIQLHDADPKSKSFPFDTKTCRYPHTIFHSQNKKSKEWLEIEVWLATSNIKMSLLQHTRNEIENNTNQNSLKAQARLQNGLLDLNRTTCIIT